MAWRTMLLGRRLSTSRDAHERVGPITGVGVLGLDALASAAYGPEALLTVLLPLGTAGLEYVLPLTLVIIGVLLIVSISYRQTIEAYPNGGGAYTVAKENLGVTASLVAAAALALDYILNVAVAISAGVGTLISALPGLRPHSLALCLATLGFLTWINLRGVRATGRVLLVPTCCFVIGLLLVMGVGLSRAALHGGQPPGAFPPLTPAAPPLEVATTWLLVRAFANGCTAMTGIEAVSNGVPLFRPPPEVAARRTLLIIVCCLVLLLLGVAGLARAYGIGATAPGQPGYESVLSRLTAAVLGRGPLYYATMAAVIAVLLLSANTSFADFPRVCRMLAGDRYLPEPFVHRGHRLTFSHGIIALSSLSALLLALFQGITDALIPLFAVGALLAFTMSQAGMVAHFQRSKVPGARRSQLLSAVGACATALALAAVLASKLPEGAWISILLLGAMLMLFKGVRRHYDFLTIATATSSALQAAPPQPPLAVVPMRRWDGVALKAMRFALGFSSEVIAVQVLTGDREVDDLSSRWRALAVEDLERAGRPAPRLVVLRSEYRELYEPLLDFVRALEREHPDRQVAVIVPELVEPRWYHHLLHSNTASLLKALLLFRGGPQIVIVSAPWYLEDWLPERRRLFRRK